MSEVIVVGVMQAKEGHEDDVAGSLKEVAVQTHGEEGCILYAVHRGADDPGRIVLVERWRSREDLQEHLAKPYIQALGGQVEMLAEPPQVLFLNALRRGTSARASSS